MLEDFGTDLPEDVVCCFCNKRVPRYQAKPLEIDKNQFQCLKCRRNLLKLIDDIFEDIES